MKAQLHKLISEDKLSAVTDQLLLHYQAKDQNLYKVVLAVSARLNKWKLEKMKGILETETEYHKIRSDLIDLIDALEKDKLATNTAQHASRESGDKTIAVIKSCLDIADHDAALLAYLLADSTYAWRFESTIMAKTGWEAQRISDLVILNPSLFQRSVRTDKRVIYALHSPLRIKVRQELSI